MSERKRGIELDVDGIGTGSITVGGIDMSRDVIGIGIEVAPGTMPEVKLRMRPGVVAALADAEVRIDSATSAALIELGWTPPRAEVVLGTVEEFDSDEPPRDVANLNTRLDAAVRKHLQHLAEAGEVKVGETGAKLIDFVLTWHPIVPDPADDQLRIYGTEPVEIPLRRPWLMPGTNVAVGEFRLSTREVPGGEVAST